MNIYKQHPLSAAFPAMNADEFTSLKDSIETNGVLNPITIFEDMVIDGWHRYTAANEVGMECPSVLMEDAIDPKDFVMAQNKARRHITATQLAMATTAVYAWKPLGSNQHLRVDIDVPPSKSNAQLAEIAGVHLNTIKQSKVVQSHAAPEVLEAVKRGELGLPKAAAIAKLPIQEQAAAINKPLPKPAPVVEPEAEEPDYTPLDAALDQVSQLQSELVVARMGDIPEEQKTQAAERFVELEAYIKTLDATLKAVTNSRDSLMEENAQLKRQCQMQRKEIDKLKKST